MPRSGERNRGSATVLGVGLLVLVIGTFLPWLRSGSSERTSYAAAGVLRSVLRLDAPTRAVLLAWPLLPLLCAISLGLVIAGFSRTGSSLATVCALGAAVACVRVLALQSDSLVGVVATGPAVTLVGCGLVLAGAVTLSIRALHAGAEARRSRRL